MTGVQTCALPISKFITKHNVVLGTLDPSKTLAQLKGRQVNVTLTRDGSMPGTQAAASTFQSKDGSRLYDMAVIFNKQDTSKTDHGDDSTDCGRLVRHMRDKIKEVF